MSITPATGMTNANPGNTGYGLDSSGAIASISVLGLPDPLQQTPWQGSLPTYSALHPIWRQEMGSILDDAQIMPVLSYETTPLSDSDESTFGSGVFTVGETGAVSIDFLFDGGGYEGDLAMFGLEGMETLKPGTKAFIQEAARRALTNSTLGHIVISDPVEGARFKGALPHERDLNEGDYTGNKTFAMTPGDRFGFMLVPDGWTQEVFEKPGSGGSKKPLFSMATIDPDDALDGKQFADVTGDGIAFGWEDLSLPKSDHDYNDIIFRIQGTTGEATQLSEVIAPKRDWRNVGLGQEVLDYASLVRSLLFTPADPNKVPDPVNIDNPAAVRQRFVEVNFELLATPGSSTTQTLKLNLFEDTFVEVDFEPAGFSSNQTNAVHIGKVKGASYSEIILIERQDMSLMVGNFNVDDRFYQIRYVGEGVHIISELNPVALPDEITGSHHLDSFEHGLNSDLPASSNSLVGINNKSLTINDLLLTANSSFIPDVDNGSTIDVMVVFTPAALQATLGGEPAMDALINLAEAETNRGYQNSGVNQRIRIVHRQGINYAETNSSRTDVNRLQNPTDGFMDEVHALQNAFSADMVTLIANGNYGGEAFDILSNANEDGYRFEDRAFNVVSRQNMQAGNFTFAHELGHLQGAGHNIEDAGNSGAYPFPYSFGYRDPDGDFRTIMAYDNGTGIPRRNIWSNLNFTFDNQAVGTSAANNALSLNNTAVYAANWRHSNDHVANAREISGSFITTTGLNVNATEEAGEVDHAGNEGGRSVWWTWTAPHSGPVTISTAGSNFDTLLGVYTGTSVSDLALISSNNDASNEGNTSRVTFDVIAGTTYQIAVDGYNGASGQVQLNIQRPITLIINQVKGDFDPDGLIPEGPLRGDSDFYARFSFDQNPYETDNWQKSPRIDGDNDIEPNWGFTSGVTGSIVPITIQVFDYDGRGPVPSRDDDHVDLDPNPEDRDLNLTYNVQTGEISGDLSGVAGQQLYSSGGKGEIWFTIG